MPLLTVRQAAQHVGVSRQTLFRHVKQGKVSATVAHDGELRIDTTELLRVYGPLQSPVESPTVSSSRLRLPQATSDSAATVAQIEVERLKAQVESKSAILAMAQERIAELKERVEEARADNKRLLEIIERQSRLLPAPAAQAESKPARKKGKR